jgi:hypothetical protein
MTARQLYSVWRDGAYTYYIGEPTRRPSVRTGTGLHLGEPLETVLPILPAGARPVGHGTRALGTIAQIEAAR